MAKHALDKQLAQIPVNLTLQYYSYGVYRGNEWFPSSKNLTTTVGVASSVECVASAEAHA